MSKAIKCYLGNPRAGELTVIRSPNQPSLRRGDVIPLAELSGLGKPISVDGNNRVAVDLNPDPNEPYYQVFTVDREEGRALAGQWQRCVCIPDVSNLNCFLVEGGVRLRWRWPTGCTQALVLSSTTAPPGDPQKNADGNWTFGGIQLNPVNLEDYIENCDSYELQIDTAAGPWYITVRLLVGGILSEGTDPESRCQIPKITRSRLDYLVFQEGGQMVLEWRLDPPCAPFPFKVQGRNDAVPTTRQAGITYFPLPGQSPDWPDPSSDGMYRWQRPWPAHGQDCYARLFLENDTVNDCFSQMVAVRHPDKVLNPVGPQGGLNSMWPRGSFFLADFPTGGPRTILCPYCFEKFNWWEAKNLTKDGQEKPLLGWVKRAQAALCSWQVAPEKLLTDKIKKICPRYCSEVRQKGAREIDLDNTLFRHQSVHIALSGTVLAGKSHWLFSASRKISFGLRPIDLQTIQRLEECRLRIVEKRGRLPRTRRPSDDEVVPPFLYASAWRHGARRMVLALCDVDGESWGIFGQAGKMRYLQNANGYVLILDPLQLPNFRQFLGANLPQDAPLDSECRPQDTALINLLGALAQRERPPHRTPIAVVVSKADVLKEREPRLRAALWDKPLFQKSGGNAVYDLAIHWLVQFAVREFLLQYDPNLVHQIEGNFKNFAYFCVAPTGTAATTEHGDMRFHKFAPWRVEEPLLWLFFQLGLIPGV